MQDLRRSGSALPLVYPFWPPFWLCRSGVVLAVMVQLFFVPDVTLDAARNGGLLDCLFSVFSAKSWHLQPTGQELPGLLLFCSCRMSLGHVRAAWASRGSKGVLYCFTRGAQILDGAHLHLHICMCM